MAVYKIEKNGKKSYFCTFRYKDFAGKVHQKKKEGFMTKHEALEFERDFLQQYTKTDNILFKNLIEKYLNYCKTRIKASTLEQKALILKKIVVPALGELNAREISSQQIIEFQNKLTENKKNYSQSYLRTVHSHLSAVFNFAIRNHGLKINPAAIAGPIGSLKPRKLEFWTKEEFKKFIATVDDPIDYTIFNLLFFTGMRSGELLALTPGDFDFNKKSVHISKTFSHIPGKGDLITSPKTEKSDRFIILPDFLIKIIKDYIQQMYDLAPDDRLFHTTKHSLRRSIKSGCKKSGVKLIRIHDLRHSHASLLIELGFSPLMIAERLGHEKVETTLNRYAHLYPNKQSALASKLDTLFNNKPI